MINADLGRIAIFIEGPGAFDAASGLIILKELSSNQHIPNAPVRWTVTSDKEQASN